MFSFLSPGSKLAVTWHILNETPIIMEIFLLMTLFSLIATAYSIFLPTDSRWAKETLIRIEKLSENRQVNDLDNIDPDEFISETVDYQSIIVAEEERLVHFLMEAGDIVECGALKRIQHQLDHLMAEVARFEETGVMPPGVTWSEVKVDVGW